MTKRLAVEETPEASPLKKRYIEDDDEYFDDGLNDGEDDDYSPIPTPNSSADVDSPVTAATTPRTKFPSDYKTLACTWPGCAKSFNRPARLRDHMNSHTNSRPHKCPYDGCDKDYIEDKHLKQHIKAVHKNERKYICQRDGCGKSFVTGTRLKRHQAVHEGADRFRCQNCGQSFRKKETLNKHVRKEHMGQRAYPCTEPGCTSGFDTKPALNRHKERDHGEPKYWCSECGPKIMEDGTVQRVGFTTDTFLQQHMRQEHQNCLFCDYKSSSQWEFQTHIEIHHSGKTVEDRKTVACPYENCKKKFTKKSNLNVHIRTAHEGFRFVCGEMEFTGPGHEAWSNDQGCGDKFSTKVRLEDHIRYIHLGQERPKLTKPDKSVLTDVIDEIAGVSNIKRQTIKCPSCGEGFSRYYDLNLHIAHIHNPNLDETTNSTPFMSSDLGEEHHHFETLDSSSWIDNISQEEIFAAQMDYNPPHDEWLNDEANILLLTRGETGLGHSIDPMLGGF